MTLHLKWHILQQNVDILSGIAFLGWSGVLPPCAIDSDSLDFALYLE